MDADGNTPNRLTNVTIDGKIVEFSHPTWMLIVNDMSVDPSKSAALMCLMAHALKRDAVAVMTIKLPTLKAHKHINEASVVLKHAFKIIDIRHLFHNRQEVTAYLVRTSEILPGWEESLVPRGSRPKH